MPASDKIKETARAEAERVSNLANEAARSGAYLYPLRVRDTSYRALVFVY